MEGQAYTIVGIVENVVHNFIERLPSPSAYFAVDQHPVQSFDVVIRTAADPDSLIPAARAELKAVDPSIPLFLPRSFRKLVRDSVTGIAYVAGTLTVLGVVALLLAAIGVYSLLAFAVGERTREFGVRLAVGATPREIFTLVFRRGFGLALIGLSAGLLAGFAFARLLSGLFFGVSPSDPIAFGAVPAVLLSCVTLACWLPASRAMRTDPVNALHHE
jgi:ABC-type antimicrobial peptide transport system permease subunit